MKQQEQNNILYKIIRNGWAKLSNISFVISIIIYRNFFDPIIYQVDKMKIFKDMDENQYWLTLWTFCITAFIVFITVIDISSYTEDVIVADLVREGHDPLELACLYNLSGSLESSCMIISQAKAKAIIDATK